MIADILCFLRHGKTRFGLMEKYGISLMRINKEGNEKEWSACSGKMEFDFAHSGQWSEGDTPYKAMIKCIEEIKRVGRNKSIPKEDYGKILHKRPDPDTMPPTDRP